MIPLHIVLLVCGAASAPSPTVHDTGDFRFRVKVVEALEGGPCVIEVEFSYEGKKELPNCHEGPIGVQPPRSWKTRPVGAFDASIARGGGSTIKKGHKSRSIHFLNQDYAIPAGPARLKISKEIWQAVEGTASKERPEGEERVIASPSVEIVIDVPPATPKNVAAFCERFERQIEDRHYCRNRALCCLDYAQHPALAALAWRIMERYPAGGFDWRIVELAAEHSESAEVAEAHFLKLAENSRFESRPIMFSYWGDRRKLLSPAAFATLLQSERLWTRVLTYVHFSKRCEQPWIDALLRDLKGPQKPIPADRFTRLLREMDSESFAARAKAMAQLAVYGERAEAQLKQALRRPLSPEVTRRVRQLLEAIDDAKASPEWRPIVEYLRSTGQGREADAVLLALSKGTPEAALTQAAKKALQERERLYPKEQ